MKAFHSLPIVFGATLTLIGLSGCSASGFEPADSARALRDDGIAMIVYEGLPHQDSEIEAYERELKRPDVVTFELQYPPEEDSEEFRVSYPFYKEPLNLSQADAKELRRLLGNGRTIQEWKGPKACGAFHPDYAVEWKDEGATVRALFCFGCHEAALVRDGQAKIYDLEEVPSLEKLLKRYRKNRPEPDET